MGEWDDMSLTELLSTEVARRHSNPDWRSELAKRGMQPLLVEYSEIEALRAYVRYQMHEARESVGSMLAAKLLRNNRAEMAERLRRQREVAGKAASTTR